MSLQAVLQVAGISNLPESHSLYFFNGYSGRRYYLFLGGEPGQAVILARDYTFFYGFQVDVYMQSDPSGRKRRTAVWLPDRVMEQQVPGLEWEDVQAMFGLADAMQITYDVFGERLAQEGIHSVAGIPELGRKPSVWEEGMEPRSVSEYYALKKRRPRYPRIHAATPYGVTRAWKLLELLCSPQGNDSFNPDGWHVHVSGGVSTLVNPNRQKRVTLMGEVDYTGVPFFTCDLVLATYALRSIVQDGPPPLS